jgi:uncharacterized Tic20 family protein
VGEQIKEKLTIDWTGIGLIALGLGCLQVMLDRGEDEDWFYSNFIRTFGVLTLVGIIGAIYWLVYARKPVVDLHCMKDRNFAISSLLMAGMAMILYGSSVVIPQLAQQDLGYTATWSGLVLSPGAVLIVLTIPLVLKLMPVVQTRWIIAFGFTCLAVSFFWSRTLTPDIDFETLVLFRSAQSIGLGFLFVPLTTIAFISIPRRLNADAAALFTMFRNVAGSIGISLSTAAITERAQAHSAHLAYHASPFNEQFQQAIRESAQAIQNFTTQVGDPTGIATGRMYQTMIEQSRFLAYIDVFTILSAVALLLIPFCLLLSPVKSEGVQEHIDDTQTFTPLMIMMLLAGCAVGPDYQQPAPPAVTHWNDKGDSAVKSQTTSAATNPRWWKTFGSPQLDSLVERAIAGNLTLQQTVLRIAGAREQINQAGGAFYPSVNGNLQATRQQLGLEGELKSHGVYDQLDNVDPNCGARWGR